MNVKLCCDCEVLPHVLILFCFLKERKKSIKRKERRRRRIKREIKRYIEPFSFHFVTFWVALFWKLVVLKFIYLNRTKIGKGFS